MAKIIEVTVDHNTNLYDGVERKDCVTEKVVDITEDCPGIVAESLRAYLRFTRDGNGRIVQMFRTDPGEEALGWLIHFPVNTLTDQLNVRPQDDTFGLWAEKLGRSKHDLMSLIFEHAPAS